MIDTLVKRFADSVVAQSDAMQRGDANTGNSCALDGSAAFVALCQQYGNDGREALAALLNRERADIRVRAAASELVNADETAVTRIL